MWGSRPWIDETFGPASRTLSVTARNFVFRYPSADDFIDFFRTWYGPVHKAFLALDESGREALAADMRDLVARFNTANDGTMRVPSEYAEVVAVKA
jgi:hypothetical protein